jgi:predicted transcriptional regulator
VERVRLSADVEPELRRQVKIAAARSDCKVSDWIANAVRRELEREEAEGHAISRASVQAYGRDWDSWEDAIYDEVS